MTSPLSFAFAAAGALTAFYALRTLKLRYTIASVCLGVAALFAANLITGFLSFRMPVNTFTVLVSAVGGIPGVVLLHVLSAIFGAQR